MITLTLVITNHGPVSNIGAIVEGTGDEVEQKLVQLIHDAIDAIQVAAATGKDVGIVIAPIGILTPNPSN